MEKNRKKNGVPIVSSLRFKIGMMLLGAAAVTATIILMIVIPNVRSILEEQTKNYLFDVTSASGATLETLEKDEVKDKNEMKQIFQSVGVEGISSSYAYVVDEDGIMIYHPTADKIGQPVENEVVKGLVEDIKEGFRPEAQVVTYDYHGVMKYAAYYVNEDRTAIVVVSADEDEIMKPVSTVFKLCILAFCVVIVLILVASVFLINIFISPVVKVSDIVGKMAEMDFTENEGTQKLVSRKDETGMMSRSVAALRKEMVSMIEDIQKQSGNLYTASENLEKDANQTNKTVEQVEYAVNEIASGATSQAQETQNATEHVITMGQMIEETNAEAGILENNSRQMQQSSNQAISILNELMDVNQKTIVSIDEIYRQTSVTNASAEKIQEATAIITSIAEETNLLSLNASIEAARAGEQGRGFAVVASQIQKLAEQSNESARTIDEITADLIHNSTRGVEIMKAVQEIMDEQTEKMQQTDEMFRQVNQGVAEALDGVLRITKKTESLNDSRTKVVDVVQNLSAIAEENAAGSEETSASVTEVRSVVTDISDNAATLKDVAYELDQSVKKFRL